MRRRRRILGRRGWDDVGGWGEHELRVAAVGLDTGNLRVHLAQYLLAVRALLATAARGVETGHTKAGSRLHPTNALADLLDHARDLVARYERELGRWEGTLQNCYVAVADAAGVTRIRYLTCTEGGPLALLDSHLAVCSLMAYHLHHTISSVG
jgi:hypothetical protein